LLPGNKPARNGLPPLFKITNRIFQIPKLYYGRGGTVFLDILRSTMVSVAQFNTANSQLVQASEANSKAENALKKATAIETQVLDARRDVLKVPSASWKLLKYFHARADLAEG
jgi:hypothetical protein